MKHLGLLVGGLALAFGLGTMISNPNSLGSLPQKMDVSSDKKSLTQAFAQTYPSEYPDSTSVKEVDLVAKPTEITLIDGAQTSVWAYNDKVPGPELRIKFGETLRVNFTNNLPDETTIHWHGVRVPNAMDGVPGVTQEPVQPGEQFVYEFIPKDAGTFWFHPHVRGSEQVERGLYGALIVEDEQELGYSQDFVWVLDDWRLTNNGQVDPNFNTMHDLAHDGRWGQYITINGKQRETLFLNPGERIRLRLINVANGRVFAPDFGRLDAQVIAVDGMYVKEHFSASGFELSPGNRIDVDITVPADFSAKQVTVFDTFSRSTPTLASISISDQVVSTPDIDVPLNQNIPDWSEALSLPSDKTYVLNARRSRGGSGMGMGMGMMGIEWTINGKAYPDYDSITLKVGEFQKIAFQNDSTRLHPMHLHGQFFKVLNRNGQPVSEEYLRDTVLIHSKETVEIGLVPQDKGSWANHCHILEHAEAGMMTVVEVR